jgi:hypothetical protein
LNGDVLNITPDELTEILLLLTTERLTSDGFTKPDVRTLERITTELVKILVELISPDEGIDSGVCKLEVVLTGVVFRVTGV